MPKGKHKNHRRGETHSQYRHGEIHRIDGKRVASPEYRTWQAMRNRCCNSDSQDWAYYGGRGIRVVERWESFENFLADMGRRPSAGYTLERKNSNGNYSKRNCMWATREQQARNRDYVKLSMSKAREIRVAEGRQVDIAARFEVSQGTVSQVRRGVTWREEAVE